MSSVALQSYDLIRDASAAISRDPGARFLGGGTLLIRAINEGTADFTTLVRVTDRSLSEIKTSGGTRVRLGAGVTMNQILANPSLSFLHPAARAVGGPAVRAQATVGGNLYAPPPYGDLTAVLLALDAKVMVQSGYSAREVPLAEFLARTTERSQAIVVGIEATRPRRECALRFLKVTRVRPKGASLLSIAVRVEETGGRLSGVRVAYAGMAPTPLRIGAVERVLEGRQLDCAAIQEATAAATEGCTPPTDAMASSWYRREVAAIHLTRLLSREWKEEWSVQY